MLPVTLSQGFGTGGGGEGADDAECLVEAAVGVLVSSIFMVRSIWRTSWFLSFLEVLRRNLRKCCLMRYILLTSVHS